MSTIDSNHLDPVGKVALYPLTQLITQITLDSKFVKMKGVVDNVKSLCYVQIHNANHISNVQCFIPGISEIQEKGLHRVTTSKTRLE